jgi:hypothetical protein
MQATLQRRLLKDTNSRRMRQVRRKYEVLVLKSHGKILQWNLGYTTLKGPEDFIV